MNDRAAPAEASMEAPEREIAHDLFRRALLVTPIALVIAGVFAGWEGVIGAALGMVVVAGNFVMLARLMTVTGRANPGGVAAGAMIGYLALLVVITLLALAVRELSFIDLGAFVLTVGVAHLVLLAWEAPRVGLTLGSPGLKPRPLSRRK